APGAAKSSPPPPPVIPAPPARAPAAPPARDVPVASWRETPETFLGEARIRLELFLRDARAGRVESVEPLEEACQHLIRSLAEGDQLHVRALDFRKSSNDLVTHMINVAIFAVKIGNGLGMKLEALLRVALGGYLHDVGMVRYPPERLTGFQSLTPKELEELRRHPEVGYQILTALGPDYRWLADVAHQEHEREDGSGYPRGLRGDQIVEIAKIVGLADIYDSLTHPRPYRNRTVPVTLPHEAVKEILQAERQRFGERYLKGLITGLSAFPIGTVVRLNNGSVGRVVSTNKALPLRPTLEILRLGSGEEVSPPRPTSLAEHPLLYITEASPAEG
ncbi:MAG TPA: HD domain-containing phosphohydrolase, partial [Candidatus Methylomirabilis sp.]|nr:HD domain-containing phosphohydrolase [Candidatus Methylomirabilis sp.]